MLRYPAVVGNKPSTPHIAEAAGSIHLKSLRKRQRAEAGCDTRRRPSACAPRASGIPGIDAFGRDAAGGAPERPQFRRSSLADDHPIGRLYARDVQRFLLRHADRHRFASRRWSGFPWSRTDPLSRPACRPALRRAHRDGSGDRCPSACASAVSPAIVKKEWVRRSSLSILSMKWKATSVAERRWRHDSLPNLPGGGIQLISEGSSLHWMVFDSWSID